MKRHLSNLLQGKRSEFDGAAPAAAPASRRAATTMPAELNGYDWLRRIKHARVVRAANA
ncbi:hypothetical protein [Rhodanobacter sp. Root480]|jgi:hypothetical protein|uniref:hypothetical protein n=1 Tax=Rhodanobacter sp. Root480 TaxID=1736542 RepID=UPI000A46DBA7|nr:hypothetical protein [Rhodanobacter sp. Root480]